MLREQLIDGAILPEPYTTLAKRQGHNCIFTPNDTATTWACLAIRKETNTNSLRHQQLISFFRTYNKSVEKLNSGTYDAKTLLRIWTDIYELPREVADSVVLPHFPKTALPKAKDADVAMRWLQERERRIRKTQRDSLFLNLF